MYLIRKDQKTCNAFIAEYEPLYDTLLARHKELVASKSDQRELLAHLTALKSGLETKDESVYLEILTNVTTNHTLDETSFQSIWQMQRQHIEYQDKLLSRKRTILDSLLARVRSIDSNVRQLPPTSSQPIPVSIQSRNLLKGYRSQVVTLSSTINSLQDSVDRQKNEIQTLTDEFHQLEANRPSTWKQNPQSTVYEKYLSNSKLRKDIAEQQQRIDSNNQQIAQVNLRIDQLQQENPVPSSKVRFPVQNVPPPIEAQHFHSNQDPSTSSFVRESFDRATPLTRKKTIRSTSNEVQITDNIQDSAPTVLRHKTPQLPNDEINVIHQKPSNPNEIPINQRTAQFKYQETLLSDVELRELGEKYFRHLIDFHYKPNYARPAPPTCTNPACQVYEMISRNSDGFNSLIAHNIFPKQQVGCNCPTVYILSSGKDIVAGHTLNDLHERHSARKTEKT